MKEELIIYKKRYLKLVPEKHEPCTGCVFHSRSPEDNHCIVPRHLPDCSYYIYVYAD